MPTPTDHHLVITDQRGEQIRGKVVYLQARSERVQGGPGENETVVHILTRGWLEPYRYRATYNTPTASVAGFYVAYRYKVTEDNYLVEGSFERAL